MTLHKWRAKYISTRNLTFILSVIIGMAAGLAAAMLKHAVYFIQDLLFQLQQVIYIEYLYLVFPLVGLALTVLFVIYLNRNKLGPGIPNVLYSINKKSGYMEPDKIYSHMATSSLTVGFGGSVGLEAPIVTTGSAIGSNLARLAHLSYKKRLLMIGCGAAAATSAIFGAPIAGVIFALEILLLELSVPSFIPLLLASVTGMIVSTLLNGVEEIALFNFEYHLAINELPLYMLLGVITGAISVYFTRMTYFIEAAFQKVRKRMPKALVAGLLVGLMIFIFPPLYGEGYDTIRALLSDRPELLLENSLFEKFSDNFWLLLLFVVGLIAFKALATPLTMAGGGNGGFFAPVLFIGSLTGFLFARIFNVIEWPFPLVESAFALVAMAGLMSGIMHAPLTGIFLIAEITSGYTLVVPLMIVSAISYLTVMIFEPHSIYTKQLAAKGLLLSGNKDKQVLTLLNIRRVIETDLKTVHPDALLGEMIEVVKNSTRNIFPVVDENKKLHGIILLDDIREIIFKPKLYDTIKVYDLMHAPPAFVYLEESMDVVMNKFEDTGAWNLPVLDGEKYVGFLSKSKIFNVYRTMLIRQGKEE